MCSDYNFSLKLYNSENFPIYIRIIYGTHNKAVESNRVRLADTGQEARHETTLSGSRLEHHIGGVDCNIADMGTLSIVKIRADSHHRSSLRCTWLHQWGRGNSYALPRFPGMPEEGGREIEGAGCSIVWGWGDAKETCQRQKRKQSASLIRSTFFTHHCSCWCCG